MDKEKELATIIHKQTCHFNHTDYCGWYYDVDDDKGKWNVTPTTEKYLDQARNILSSVDFETAKTVIYYL